MDDRRFAIAAIFFVGVLIGAAIDTAMIKHYCDAQGQFWFTSLLTDSRQTFKCVRVKP